MTQTISEKTNPNCKVVALWNTRAEKECTGATLRETLELTNKQLCDSVTEACHAWSGKENFEGGHVGFYGWNFWHRYPSALNCQTFVDLLQKALLAK